jgi:hypothetical protein
MDFKATKIEFVTHELYAHAKVTIAPEMEDVPQGVSMPSATITIPLEGLRERSLDALRHECERLARSLIREEALARLATDAAARVASAVSNPEPS